MRMPQGMRCAGGCKLLMGGSILAGQIYFYAPLHRTVKGADATTRCGRRILDFWTALHCVPLLRQPRPPASDGMGRIMACFGGEFKDLWEILGKSCDSKARSLAQNETIAPGPSNEAWQLVSNGGV